MGSSLLLTVGAANRITPRGPLPAAANRRQRARRQDPLPLGISPAITGLIPSGRPADELLTGSALVAAAPSNLTDRSAVVWVARPIEHRYRASRSVVADTSCTRSRSSP